MKIQRCLFLFTVAASATLMAEPPVPTDRVAVLKALPIDAGKAVSIERITEGQMTAANGAAYKNLPSRTVVKLVLNPAKGSNIRVEAWLPDPEKWNGRFLGLGNGGAAGNINPGSFAGPITEGYAVATTDMGTAPNSDSGIGNKEVWKDFGFRATHLMTVTAKQLIKAYYGKAPEYSYFNGGSTGGQQALQEAQRYPEDYDGIVANVPAHCRTPLHAYFLWNDQILRQCPFTESQEANIIAAGNEYMASREIPQTAGKLVSDPRYNKADIEAVIVLARKKDSTLTERHAEAMRKLFDGPKHLVTGERIFCGIPFGSSFKAAHGHLYLFRWVFGPDKNLAELNFGADIDTYTAALAPYLNAENPDLSAFEKRGGKLLMISGTADSVVPFHASIDYYERAAEHFGSLDKVRSFLRLYLVPGMSHGPGPGINKLPSMLNMVINWREKNAVPDVIQGQRIINGKTEIDIPLYPYPGKTGWDEAGGFKKVDGPRVGVDRISARFIPPAAD
ncbi:tannase/feruloyl esterase family alpha/beta hydrolase [Verrucomicrobium sp. BvORR034]|uniref:tannase/feruloyl esterase family alpha/beta hydrolase n=1 Tax=Verrucomicrobium sp. BvORR034 TaxID=1396418 RepID=UPI00224103E0|nr:tannase/feruloyl esterase family alpha/beta hydrolase [Verrucomicrobium sp. BvORR034]